MISSPASAELTGELRIMSDMSSPAPRAAMEDLAAGFGAMHPELNIEDGNLPGLAPVKGAMTLNGKQWGVPYTYYQWGIYYREDMFQDLGLVEPVTLDAN
ncbi:MAG: multiple sugar transport system substrate-binding protein [Ascidiaceihabitans sp.]|jgi:multiple sugar transport system substrate-binding protein|tara:strand:- start:166 stop:465 length:300 start_codon:yes stop_codon:yes gene_type:complete